VGRVILVAICVLLGLWLVGSVAQGLLVSTSLTARKIWLFTWLWQRFALGLVIGIVIGYIGAQLTSRRRVTAG
jgi:NhaP-type Na+/H+ and K+/H+ antiporter